MKPKHKALILLLSFLAGCASLLLLSGCDTQVKASQRPASSTLAAHDLEGEATINPHVGAPYTAHDLNTWYWKGVRDQAWSEHTQQPIYQVQIIEGREILYAPIEYGPKPPDSDYAKQEEKRQDKLDIEDGLTVEKKGKK